MRQIGLVSLALAAAVRLAGADPSPLTDALARNSYALSIADGKLAGKGADVLRPAISTAHFVMLGEDHGIAQIPAFGAALCGELAPFGFPPFAAGDPHGWTLFDLRALRPSFRKLGPIEPELERVIFGHDFVVLIPDPKPQHAR